MPAGIVGGIEYATDLFDAASIERLASRFVRVLEAAVAHPERALSSVDILGADERATILGGWNATAHALPASTLPELFAAQVARSPDAIAVIFEEERLCYRELDRRANRLAHHLRARGVGPETVVGLCLARSLDLIVGLLGILKAGGAYLPLDPDYPPARLAFMLEDAGAEVLVTQDALLERLSAATAAACAGHRAARCRCARHCGGAAEPPRRHARPGQPRLCHLHLRLHRDAKRGAGRAAQYCGNECGTDFLLLPIIRAALPAALFPVIRQLDRWRIWQPSKWRYFGPFCRLDRRLRYLRDLFA